jgi:acyl dehydratase
VTPMSEQTLATPPGMLGLFARAGTGMIPGLSALPLIGGRRAADLPVRALVLEAVRTDRERLAAYDRVCGFDLRDALPATYPHMLAFPLHLALMTDPSFPFGAIGLVHVYNRIAQRRPIDAGETLAVRVWANGLRRHPRGLQFDIHTQVHAGDELVWEEVSTNLRIGERDEAAQGPEVASAEELPATATWRLSGDLGRRYAAVSGDYNPIHIHPLSARLFGFRSAIAHGMWTQARCLAALEPILPGAFTVEVAFKRPIVLPARVDFAERSADGELRFGVRRARDAKPHLDGVVHPA